MNNQEIWKDIEGYEGLYQVSNFGRIKSLAKISRNRYSTVKRQEKLLKLNINTNGYSYVNLYKNNKYKNVRIHRLVAIAFILNPLNLPCINHKDGCKINNYIENLEWCTHSYNNFHSFRLGRNQTKGETHPKAKLSEKQVIEIIKRHKKGETQWNLSREFKVSHTTIRYIVIGKNWGYLNAIS